MSVEIRVATEYLRSLEQSAVIVIGKLQAFNSLPGSAIAGSDGVGEGYRHLSSRWDERRADLEKGLQAAADALSTIRRAFEEQDERLASDLGAT